MAAGQKAEIEASDIEGHDYEPDDALEDDADDNVHGLDVEEVE